MFSEQTRIQYLFRARKMMRKYFRKKAKTWQDDPNAFVDWMAKTGTDWVKSTWRLTFRTVEVAMEADGAPGEALEYLKQTARNGYRDRMSSLNQKRRLKGGQQRRKSLSEEDLQQLLDVLRRQGAECNGKLRSSQYDALLLAFMEMNVHPGLRPNEAADIHLEQVVGDAGGPQWAVRVRNSKISESRRPLWVGREYRMLTISEELSVLTRRFIDERDRLLVLVPKWADLQKALARRIRDLADALELYGITLYTTRHQFAANGKKGGVGGGSIAKSMGHSSDKTSRRYYGPAKSGWRPDGAPMVSDAIMVGENSPMAVADGGGRSADAESSG